MIFARVPIACSCCGATTCWAATLRAWLRGMSSAPWRPVGKRRRISRFALASGRIVTHAAAPVHEPRCDVELTEIRTPGQESWSLGFEATGPADLLSSALEGTAALVFAQALPVMWNPARMNPGPTPSGWPGSQAPKATPASEDHFSAEPRDPRGMRLHPE
jgi:hypothetical protein